MTPPPGTASEALTIGRAALLQLHQSLLRDRGDRAITVLQESGYAAGEGVYQAFCAWLPAQGIQRPEDVDAARLGEVLSRFFQDHGWGSLSVAPVGPAAVALDSTDWVEAEPGTAEGPMCYFSSGMLADFLGRLSGQPVAVLEVECRSRNDGRCRFLSASPDTLNTVYDQLTQGRSYAEALGA